MDPIPKTAQQRLAALHADCDDLVELIGVATRAATEAAGQQAAAGAAVEYMQVVTAATAALGRLSEYP